MNKKRFVKAELIGLTIEITNSKNKSLMGLKGKIIDETKNMLTIEKNNIIKRIIKNQSTLYFPKQKIKINFTLPKSCYATVALEFFFQQHQPQN